ncbi:E3 ubiquitin-protein ligase [Morus notabilis]|uniref:RBR-type E3 ubiquitin transferase n=1 Tax=Morus notabilis TaxID=981085 RepID=W9QIL5_9ROSA|nr:E3 ubiquitin-protein ligase [Morus notabilis]
MGKSAEEYNYHYICPFCMDGKNVEEMFRTANCSHNYEFCVDCIGKYVAAKVGENVISVRCPYQPLCHGVLTPKICRSALPEEFIDRWEAAICEYHIASTQNVIYCPFEDCSAPLVVDGGRKFKAVKITSAECPHCHRLFCARCQVPWHAGSKCKNYNLKSMDRKFRGLVRVQKWKRCPKCNFYVEKDSGCDHIICRSDNNLSP